MANAALNDNALRAQVRGAPGWLSDGGSRGAGRLIAKEAVFYFSYFATERGKQKRRFLTLGSFPAMSVRAARAQAAKMSRLLTDGVQDLHAHFERENEARETAAREAQETARRKSEREKSATLRELLDAYLKSLSNERTVRDVRSSFSSVFASPLAQRRAALIEVEDFVPLLARLVEEGKGRTANKVRSYLRAAYQLALDSKFDASAPLVMRSFGVTSNPLASVRPLSKFSGGVDERYLDANELGAFVRRLDEKPQGVIRDAVELGLLLAGQRTIQLLRLRPQDVDMPGRRLTIYDSKGARTQDYAHKLPLSKRAAAIVQRRLDEMPEGSPYVFTTDGASHMNPETTNVLVKEIAAAMLGAKEARADFAQKHIRKSAETQLAAMRVSSDVRAMLLSHGLGGVQKKHYDFHDYREEMEEALAKWERRLDALRSGEAAKVVPLRRAAAPSVAPAARASA